MMQLKMMALQDPSVDDEDEGMEAAAREKGWATVERAVLRRGWGLGKKVVIAAAAITSAPFVIPPLLLVSTLGLALAFPFGVYFAGFAFTDKLMRSLLPLPSPIQWEEEEEDEDEDGYGGEAEEEVRNEGGFDIKAAREETGDTGLVEEEEEPIGEIEGTPDPWSKELAPGVYPSAAAVAPELGDEGEADAGVKESWNGGLTKEEEPSGETGTPDPWSIELPSSEEKGEEGSGKKVEQENLTSIAYVEMKAAVEEMEIGGLVEEEGAAGETGPPAAAAPDSQIKIIRPISGYGMDNENRSGVEIIPEEEEKPRAMERRIGLAEEMGKNEEYCGIEIEQSSPKDKGGEGAGSTMEKVELEELMTSAVTYPSIEGCDELEMPPPSLGYVQNIHGNLGSIEIVVVEEKKLKAGSMESEVGDTNSQELLPAAPSPSSTYGALVMVAVVECEAVIEPPSVRSEYASVVEEKKVAEEVKPNKQGINGEERAAMGGMKEVGVDAPEGDRVLPPSSPLSHNCKKIEMVPSSGQRIEMVVEVERSLGDEKEAGEEDTKKYLKRSMQMISTELPLPPAKSSVVVVAPPVELEGHDQLEPLIYGLSSSDQYASEVEEDSYHSSDNMDHTAPESREYYSIEPTMPSDDEGLYNEEQIWAQIYAIRKIVGYRVTLHSSLVGELRALYLFTGVDPPVSFKDTSDLADVNEKLWFLKSVIGVK